MVGHNGLNQLMPYWKRDIRVRIGIGKPKDKADVANYV